MAHILNMILTVAIPTYNRPAQVKSTLVRLLPQLNDSVKVLVLDNCSEVVIADYLAVELGPEDFNKITVIRNIVNIGGDANFAKAFELCTTPYVWVLGDDDEIAPDAVALILSELNKYQSEDLIGINFLSNCCEVPREQPIEISSTKELANRLDWFGNWFFISTSVYKVSEYIKHLRFAYWGAYSMASQIMPAMMAISQHKKLVLSEKYIVTNVKASEEDQWSHMQVSLTLPTILELPMQYSEDDFMKIGQKLSVQFVSFPHALSSLLRTLNLNALLIDKFHIYLFRELYAKTFLFRKHKLKQNIQYAAVMFLIKNPSLLQLLLKNKTFRQRVDRGVYIKFSLFKRG